MDLRGGDLTIIPLLHDIGTWKGLEGTSTEDIQLCEGQRENQSSTYRFQLKERDRRMKELEEIVEGNAANDNNHTLSIVIAMTIQTYFLHQRTLRRNNT